jgi:hypothetical protein
MATEDELARFRRLTALEANDAVYTDAVLDGMIEDLGFDPAVKAVWTEKAASVAGLVDTTESGSSRRLSQLRESYLGMATSVSGSTTDTTTGGSFTVEIERV